MNDSYRLSRLQGAQASLPWVTFIFLFMVFFFATPYNLSWSLVDEDEESLAAERFIAAATHGTTGRRVMLIALAYYALLTFIGRKRIKLRPNGMLGWLILSLVVLAICSIIWSENQALTSRKVIVFVLFWLGALAIAMRLSYREIMLFGFFASGLTVLLGVACEIALGTFAPLNAGYRYAGLAHPNIQALNCSILILTGFNLAHASNRRRCLYLVSAVLGAVLLFLTKSRTVFWSTGFALIVLVVLVSSKRRVSAYAIFLAIFACVLLLLFVNGIVSIDIPGTVLFERFGRQQSDLTALTTLNGRIPVWEECLSYLAQRPFVGYGYESFWTVPRMLRISEIAGFTMPNAHNAYLDMALSLGLVGLALLVAILAEGFRRCLAFYNSSGSIVYLYSLSLVVFWGLANMLGSRFVGVHLSTFILYVILIKLACERQISVKESRQRRSISEISLMNA